MFKKYQFVLEAYFHEHFFDGFIRSYHQHFFHGLSTGASPCGLSYSLSYSLNNNLKRFKKRCKYKHEIVFSGDLCGMKLYKNQFLKIRLIINIL